MIPADSPNVSSDRFFADGARHDDTTPRSSGHTKREFMTMRTLLGVIAIVGVLSGCAAGRSETHNTSSLVSFLYPDGSPPPAQNAIPELRVPLRVGLAFLPSQSSFGLTQLDAAHKQELLERIRGLGMAALVEFHALTPRCRRS